MFEKGYTSYMSARHLSAEQTYAVLQTNLALCKPTCNIIVKSDKIRENGSWHKQDLCL